MSSERAGSTTPAVGRAGTYGPGAAGAGSEPGAGALLLYDGDCGFCAASVQLVLRHDRRRTLRFASLQGPTGAAIRARHPELAAVDSVIWVDDAGHAGAERVTVRSAAALRVARYLGRGWRVLGILGWLVPRPVRDAAYDLIARHRMRLTAPACVLPDARERSRFVD